MEAKKVIRCADPQCNHGNGNLLFAVSKNHLYIKCRNGSCSRWNRITFRVPGIIIDFSDAGIVQEVLPKDYHLHLENATVVICDTP